LLHNTATINVDQGDYELALEEEFPILWGASFVSNVF
jgi:hypothetical protein